MISTNETSQTRLALSLSVLALICYGVVWVIYTRFFHPLRHIPGPFQASISRYWLVSTTAGGRMEHVQRALHAKYGPLVRMGPDEVSCADPSVIKSIYPTQNPLAKSQFYVVWRNKALCKYADHFTDTDENNHAQRRRIVNQVYSLSNVLQCESRIDECSQLLLGKLDKIADSAQSLDLGEFIGWYTFDVIGQLYFGNMFGFLENCHDHNDYIATLNTLMPTFASIAQSPSYWRPIMFGSALFSSKIRKAVKAFEHTTTAARDCVAVRLAEGNSKISGQDMLGQFLEIAQDRGVKFDFNETDVAQECWQAFMAGSDTTAIALRAVFYYLLQNPDCYKRLQDEINAADEAGELSETVRYAESIRLPYFCACVKEAMRLHPSFGFTMPRVVPAGGLELSGTFIPAGYIVGMNPAVVHYDQGVFGEDSHHFSPARWLEGDSTNMEKHMLTFGAGTRTCIGRHISISEIHKLVPQILRRFKLELAPDATWQTENYLFNKQYGLKVIIRHH